jgi:chromosome segregation ATPase
MTEEENLRKQLTRCQSELEEKNTEIMGYLDEIEQLEEEVMRYEEVVGEKATKKKSKKAVESMLQINIDAKDREIRDLKDRMGALRKKNTGLQVELEQLKMNMDSSVIRVEDLRKKDKPPLNALLQDLQDKIKKKDSIIRKLKQESSDNEDNNVILSEKESLINSLNEKIEDLTGKLEDRETIAPPVQSKSQDNVTKGLIEDLQITLKKKNRKIEELNKKLSKYEKKKSKKQSTNEELIEELEKKNKELLELKSNSLIVEGLSGNETMERVVEELKTQLEKSKSQVLSLQEQLKITQAQPITNGPSNSNFDEKLKIQREMASFLQKQLDDAKKALIIKEEEITTIKNEAIRIKRKYEDLDIQLKQRDSNISNLQNQLNSFQGQTIPNKSQSSYPEINLRIKELESMIDDLNKKNIEQRLEISQLRKQ